MIFIGLGGTGNKIASELANTTNSKYISINNKNSDICIPVCKTMEEYEEKTDDNFSILTTIKGEEIYFCLAGSGLITGACLKILQQIKDNSIHVIFVNPDDEQASKEQKLRNKVCKRVLQEMVRSGMLYKIYLFDNKKIADISDVNIINYYDVINKVICDTFLSVQYLYDSDAIRDNLTSPIQACSIVAYGLSNFVQEVNLLHSLENPRFIHLLYELSESTLLKKETLNKIIEQANKNELNSYKVLQGKIDKIYCAYYTNFVQE